MRLKNDNVRLTLHQRSSGNKGLESFRGSCVTSFVTQSTLLLMVAAFILSSASAQDTASRNDQALYHLLVQKQYIELDRALAQNPQLAAAERTFYSGVLANRKNQISISIQLLEPLLPSLGNEYTSRNAIVLCTLADDYVKSFRYGDAADTYRQLSRLQGYREETAGCKAAREGSRWEMLRGSPAQKATVPASFTMNASVSPLGLLEVPVEGANYSDRWILDTGANLSAVTRSVAEQLGLTLSSTSATAQGSSGIYVPVHTAVIPELRIGSATIHDVAVLVFEDKDLNFPQVSYQIHGSIGMPVLEALGRITFHSDGKIGVREPESAAKAESKLYLERLTPLLEVGAGGTEQLLTLDTGSSGTFLSSAFYQAHRQALLAASQTQYEVAGAGGVVAQPAILLHDVPMELGGACVRFSELMVLTDATNVEDEFFGNVGQNAVRGLRSYTLDFDRMTFSAESAVPGSCANVS